MRSQFCVLPVAVHQAETDHAASGARIGQAQSERLQSASPVFEFQQLLISRLHVYVDPDLTRQKRTPYRGG
jgi:hypothetical protein